MSILRDGHGRREAARRQAGRERCPQRAVEPSAILDGGELGIARPARRHTRLAFSLIEIMVTVGLLSFIVLGLVAVFSQTQRAFTTSMAQTDVLESGRAITDMLARELAEMAPSHSPETVNFYAALNTDGFSTPLVQELPGSVIPRSNIVQRVFFLTRHNQEWSGVGYEVVPISPNSGVGGLYRYTESRRRQRVRELYSAFSAGVVQDRLTNRLAQGIVHLKLTPIAANGYPLIPINTSVTNAAFCTNAATVPARYQFVPNTSAKYVNGDPALMDFASFSNALPAFIDLELGILEPQAVERFKSFGNASPAIQRQYLSNRVGQVHLFRQRIPIRNVDLSVYQ